MVRLMLVLAPVACVTAAIAVAATLKTYASSLHDEPLSRSTDKKKV